MTTVRDEPHGSRERLVAAASKAAAEHGYREVTVERITRYAGVPRSTFERYFASPEQAMMVAYDDFLERVRHEAEDACDAHAGWPYKVKAAIGSVLVMLTEASGLARAFAVEAGSASLAAAQRQLIAIDELARLLREGRSLYPRAAVLPEPTERALIGGVASIVSAHLLAEDVQALPALESQLVELLLTPYLGAAEAKRVVG